LLDYVDEMSENAMFLPIEACRQQKMACRHKENSPQCD